MNKHFFIWGIFLLSTIWSASASVDVHVTFLTTKDGLTNNTIRFFFQDSKGFIWISTLNGLNRYDGHSFVTFLPQKDNTPSLNDQHINKMDEDKNGFLWIGSAYNIFSCYDLEHDRFVDYTGCGEYNEPYENRMETTDGISWLWGATNGCRRIEYSDGVFSSTILKNENGMLPSNKINFLVEDFCENIWICTESGLARVSKDKTEILEWKHNFKAAIPYEDGCYFLTYEGEIYYSEKGGEIELVLSIKDASQKFALSSNLKLQNHWVIFAHDKSYMFNLATRQLDPDVPLQITNGKFTQDNQGNYYIYNGTGILHYLNRATRKIKKFELISPDKIIPASGEQYKVVQDKRGLIWISVFGNGLFIYDSKKDEMTHYTYQEEGRNQVSSNFLTRLLVDRSGNIWVGSEYAGITHLSVLNEGATYIYPEDKYLTDYSNAIRMLTRLSNGDIWVGNRKGNTYIYDPSSKTSPFRSTPSSYIYTVAEDTLGQLWLGSRGKGLYVDKRWYKNESSDPHSLSYNHIFNIFRDTKGRMWVGTFGGGLNLAIQEKNELKFRHFLRGNIREQETRVITQDSYGRMWVGTDNGICVFYPDSLIADSSNYSTYNYDNDKLLGNEVKCIFRDSKDRMWIGILGRGISLCLPGEDHTKLEFTHYTTSNGLVNNMAESIIEDKNGKIWITTGYGLSRFSEDTGIFENFFFSASMQGNVHNENCALLMDDGSLLFGTNHGLALIDPEKVISNTSFPNVVFTDLKLNGISVHPNDKSSPLNRALSYTDAVKLSHDQNSFVIEFSTFDYSITNESKYIYKLEGFDKDWSSPSVLNFAAYKNLEPGLYQLKVKANNAYGIWSDQETVLQIEIKAPFWKTIWAYLIYAILVLLALYIGFRLMRNFNNLRNRIQIEKQLTEYKLVFFTNISHEFRTPLTLILGALEKIESLARSSNDMNRSILQMKKSADRMLRLVNQLLEFRKMQNNKLILQLEQEDVISFLREIFYCFKDVASDKQIDYKYNPSGDSFQMFIDRGKLDKIVYNILSNAFKYTPNEGKVTFDVSIDEPNKQLIIKITDTGVGIPKEKQKELFSRFMQSSFSSDSIGVGLHLTHELVNVYKGNISYVENKSKGSIFTVTLPLDSSVYEERDFLTPNALIQDPSLESYISTDAVDQDRYSSPLNKKKILIIEDDSDIRKFLEAELSTFFEVSSKPDGISGLEQAQSFDADLIICDVLMPGMNGLEVTRRLKDDFNTSHIPIILLTAMSTSEDELEGVKSGADIYITKPFSPKLLIAKVFQLIEQREKLRNKFSNDPTMFTPLLCSTELDKKFAYRIKVIMETELENPDFTIEEFAAKLNLGRTVFFRKVKGITGYTPNEYMRIFRLKKAVELLQEGKYNISEISYRVGIKDPLYFSKYFKAQFGVPPSTYLRSAKKKNSN